MDTRENAIAYIRSLTESFIQEFCCTPDEADEERTTVRNALRTLGATDEELKDWK